MLKILKEGSPEQVEAMKAVSKGGNVLPDWEWERQMLGVSFDRYERLHPLSRGLRFSWSTWKHMVGMGSDNGRDNVEAAIEKLLDGLQLLA